MTWSDKPEDPAGGNCYNCHRLSAKEIAYGTIGPSLLGYGKKRGAREDVQRSVYGHIYNAKAYNACANMPRFGHMGILTDAQIKDLVALLLDPESPVNPK
jgi:sulfur-oxidizing protein SoxX